MGISIWSKANPTIKIGMGYMRFGNIRMDIANAYNYEIGLINESHYKTFNQDDRKELEKRFEVTVESSNQELILTSIAGLA